MRTFVPYFIGTLAITLFGIGGYFAMSTGSRDLLGIALCSWLVAVIAACLIPSKGE